jgi:hypothetical protein
MLWRIGHEDDPAGFVPLEKTRWVNRWDDPEHEFRTGYAAEDPGTALAEVFQDYRPSVQAQATRGPLYTSKYLLTSNDLYPGREHLRALLGPSKWRWRAIVPVEIHTDARILDLIGNDRGWFEREATDLLRELDIERVTTHVLSDPDRTVTQRLARAAYDRGIAGLRYPSNAGEVPCVALFEGRAGFKDAGDAQSVTPEMSEHATLVGLDLLLIHEEADDNTAALAARGR